MHGGVRVHVWTPHHFALVQVVVVDQKIGFVGGLDLCFGRFDTHDHTLHDREEKVWPGKDYYNPYISSRLAAMGFVFPLLPPYALALALTLTLTLPHSSRGLTAFLFVMWFGPQTRSPDKHGNHTVAVSCPTGVPVVACYHVS